MQRWITRLLPLLFLTACAPHFDPSSTTTQEHTLYIQLKKTVKGIDAAEARRLSREAILYSRKLATKYKVSTPPLVHNFLVNVGMKERGLCYQWSDDLYAHLHSFHFQSIQLKPVGANIKKYWSEHNALVVLPRNDDTMHYGVLLDPWRDSGTLYFVPILKDPAYTWRIRTDRCAVYQNGK